MGVLDIDRREGGMTTAAPLPDPAHNRGALNFLRSPKAWGGSLVTTRGVDLLVRPRPIVIV